MGSSRNLPPEFNEADTYRYTVVGSDNHLWVVISDPALDENCVLAVNFTTLRPRSDKTCVIHPGEHPFITHDTCVQYLGCQKMKLGTLEEQLNRGQIEKKEPLSPVLLERIRQGITKSIHTPGFAKAILAAQGLIPPLDG